MPGGAATGGVVQAKVLISAGQPATSVASGLTAVNLLSAAVLLLLPVLTIPALIIGPPPARQLQLGLVVSVILAVVIVAVGVTALTWPRVVAATGRGIGRIVHLVRPSVTPDVFADSLLAQRERIAAAFHRRWWRAAIAAAANRMFDYAALVAALVAFGAHARPAEVLLAYVVAQAFAIIPITPGGVGFVDVGLTALLVLVGVPADTALIGTLLYRLFSFWLPIPIGVFAWAGWRTTRRADRPRRAHPFRVASATRFLPNLIGEAGPTQAATDRDVPRDRGVQDDDFHGVEVRGPGGCGSCGHRPQDSPDRRSRHDRRPRCHVVAGRG